MWYFTLWWRWYVCALHSAYSVHPSFLPPKFDFVISLRRGSGQKPVFVPRPPGARSLWCALLEGLRAQWLDLVVYLLADLLQQDHRGQADEDSLRPGLQRRRRWVAPPLTSRRYSSAPWRVEMNADEARILAFQVVLCCQLLNVWISHSSACAFVLISIHLLICPADYFCWCVSSPDTHFLSVSTMFTLRTLVLSVTPLSCLPLCVSSVVCVFDSFTVIAMVVAWITVMEGNVCD